MEKLQRTWIFIRGLGHEREHWGEFLALFQEAFPEDLIIHIDMLGAGVHHDTRPSLNIAGILKQARKDAANQAQGPYHILSISMGSMLADAWAREAPEEVVAAILINTSFGRFSAPYSRMSWKIWPHFFKALSQREESALEHLMLKIITAKQEALENWVEHRVSIRHRRPVSRLNYIRQLIAASLYWGGPAAPKIPVLILSSHGDRLCHPSCSRAIAQAWHVPHQEHPWAGHDLTFDDPHWVIDRVRTWLSHLDPSQSKAASHVFRG
jgi:pimeloyl-ACP methyl ester carboxylesterase